MPSFSSMTGEYSLPQAVCVAGWLSLVGEGWCVTLSRCWQQHGGQNCLLLQATSLCRNLGKSMPGKEGRKEEHAPGMAHMRKRAYFTFLPAQEQEEGGTGHFHLPATHCDFPSGVSPSAHFLLYLPFSTPVLTPHLPLPSPLSYSELSGLESLHTPSHPTTTHSMHTHTRVGLTDR